MLRLVVFAFACLSAGAAPKEAPSSVDLTPAMFLSGKTPYYPQQHYTTYEEMPAHCKLVHINHLARHGSRHITKLKAPLALYSTLAEALRLGKLKPRGVMVLQWVARFADTEAAKLGLLTEEGRREHEETAYRQWAHLGSDLKDAVLVRGDATVC
jgi:hypothetical protein